ncbi:transcription cofactor vestigial-like protein 2 [Glandiceps talaboti]
MSCLDVMYQSPYQTYQPYSFYQHHLPTQKFGHYKMHEPLDPVEYSGTVLTQHQPLPPPPPPLQSSQSTRSKTKDDDDSESDKEPTPEAEYISSRCVLFTYFTGDIGKHVDDHFSRALSQPSSFSADSRKSNSTSPQWKTGDFTASPMSQRNFPPSFWNSSYNSNSYPPSSGLSAAHHEPLGFRDPYSSAYTTSYTSIHQTDPWHYSLSAAQGSYTAHRSMHDLGYNMASTSPFNPRYSSLLIQPSVRSGRLATQCDLSKPADAWTTRYGEHSQISSESHAVPGLNVEASATATLEHQEAPSKDLYWF